MNANKQGFDTLMNYVCLGMGFCGGLDAAGNPSHVNDFIPEEGEVSADQFVEWLHAAEGIATSQWANALRTAFVEHMGAEVVDARQLRYSLEDDGLPETVVKAGGESLP